MNYWMVKSEPGAYSWEDFKKKKEDVWDGVRNYQARNFLRDMKLGDLVMFYHSGKEKAVVGIAEVSEESFPDPTNKDWLAVRLKVNRDLNNPVSLKEIKSEDALSEMLMLRQTRLSVMSLQKDEFDIILKMSS
ncbi:EVE domain-containing protein [Algoriphagus halophilus]|uniref:Predicted RNA-binding protein, contains PUA-like domain n=1 Tax=Algoriphagus halophilus TaxID=226505 RepID=A0A1N6H9P8_9BACT|nr:EVE domain-containing protein [Algoriphagus halophilus]SIO16558.1 Predicted RNA-binding protein, contains PUA-like domain [Algoriphagus halophilus]